MSAGCVVKKLCEVRSASEVDPWKRMKESNNIQDPKDHSDNYDAVQD
jgi:hypothetical protein